MSVHKDLAKALRLADTIRGMMIDPELAFEAQLNKAFPKTPPQVGRAPEFDPALSLASIPVITSGVLPLTPSPGQDARRIVRHGLADVLAWLGEPVGPKEGEKTHAVLINGHLHVDELTYHRITHTPPAGKNP